MDTAIFLGKWKTWTAVSLSCLADESWSVAATSWAIWLCICIMYQLQCGNYVVPWCSSVSLAAFQLPISYLFDVSLR